MSDIPEGKKRLPLPALMEREGLAEHAKKSARCPFHDDKHNSFSVWSNGNGLWFWKCHAGCGEGDEITFLEKYRNASNSDATKLFLEMSGVAGAVPSLSKQRSPSSLDWHLCVDAFTDLDTGNLVLRRRYSRQLCSFLKENGLIGKYKNCFGFPVHDRARNVVAVHYRLQDGSWRYHPRGAKVRPLIIGKLISGGTVHVFESPWDAFAFMDVSGERSGIVITLGAQNGKLVGGLIPSGATVYAWKQNDELKNGKRAGDEWLKDVAANASAKVLWPKTPEQFKDLNDWTRAGATADELVTAIANAELIRKADNAPPRIAKLTTPAQNVTYDEWRIVIEQNFPQLVRPAEICLGVVAQLQVNDVSNPFALALVDVPSSGKTITLNFFDLQELIYTTDNFTPAAFVSHASNVKRDDLDKVDLLPRIRYRTLIIRDLAPIFGANEDDLMKSLGILTRALDGEGLETDSGVHGKRGYRGDYLFMLLAGTTPIPPRVFKIMGNLGSRLFFLALHAVEKSDEELIAQNKGMTRKCKENACKTATENFLRTLWAANPNGVEWDRSSDPDECLRVIARCAKLLAALRGAINVWVSDEGTEKLSHNVPVIERPDRINSLLYNLARGHALISGRRQLTTDDLWPVLDVAFDSAPATRAKLFRHLVEANGTLATTDVTKLLRCSPPTARKEMEALSVLGIVSKGTEDDEEVGRPATEITLAKEFGWFCGQECKQYRARTPDTQGVNLFKNAELGIKKESSPCVTASHDDAVLAAAVL